ncbi:hypothetical protein GLAREA_09015 [Glarea lozoyensis ATCC 20868]|uniref:Uncharacterized protein n=1 Tax=Glarea lozoyensis (strain ATCC 20868 / MF5171) TaxID=1116229 RepID=S3DEN0_GLAL2|nr:uncharacterized protein GLAREA_09015 [Glarea lozoyensis ATCC 20868]EPE36852.1 hypothetical protein GLAREA_09015 [Glarea lozoyensis ATCC 20868]
MESFKDRLLQDTSDEEDDSQHGQKSKHQVVSQEGASFIFKLISACSICFNAIFICSILIILSKDAPLPLSKYVGLQKNVPFSFSHGDFYTSSNRSIADAAWNAPIVQSWTGLVALSEDYVQSHDLLPAQQWPWDENKRIYILNGFHNLHCLDVVRQTVLQAYDGKPLAKPLPHVVHCLDALRQEIMCNADDTPRYTGRLNEEAGRDHPVSGIGQQKLCNSWDKLYEFAIEHSACYRPVNMSDPHFPELERFKFCPDGKRVWP